MSFLQLKSVKTSKNKMNPTDSRFGHMQDMDTCAFDIRISDSDFALKDEITGACENDTDSTGQPNLEAGLSTISSAKDFSELGSQTAKSKSGSKDLKSGGLNAQEQEDQFYRGLLAATPKHYRTDYPTELHLHKVCTPHKPGKRKTVDNYKTQATVNFTPVASTEVLQKMMASEAGQDEKEIVVVYEKKCQQGFARELPPIVSVSDELVVDFLEENNIQMLLEYFLGMVILKTPADPFKYIAELADSLIKARTDESAFEDLPRVLGPVHVESMFRLYDRVGTGIITHTQYINAMDSLGLVRFNPEPDGYQNNEITKEVFNTEANTALNDLLRSFMFKTKKSSFDNPC